MKPICLLFLLLSGISTNIKACVCKDWAFMPAVQQEHLNENDYKIITGKVIQVKRVVTKHKIYVQKMGIPYNLVTVQVIQSFGQKKIAETIVIRTGTNAFHDCGFPFQEGEKYLITLSARRRKNAYFTSVCVPTKSLSQAEGDLKFLTQNPPNK